MIQTIQKYLKTLINSVAGVTHKELDFAKDYISQLEKDSIELIEKVQKLEAELKGKVKPKKKGK